MELRLKKFLATNPYPVFLADKDEIVLYSNEIGESLLQELGVGIGKKLPPSIGDFSQGQFHRIKRKEQKLKWEIKHICSCSNPQKQKIA
jgi:hypothetical protein